jgi:hypothetical protein
LPFDIENNKYLFNYLAEKNLIEKLDWFTPLCGNTDSASSSEFLSQIMTCKGFKDDDVKK